MTLASAILPLAAYAVVYQTALYATLPRGLRSSLAPVVTGLTGAALTLSAVLWFGPRLIGLTGGEPVEAVVWGVVTVIGASLLGALMLSSRRTRGTLADPRLAGLSRRHAALQIFVRIPVFTALIEEAFFRGLLHAALVALYPMEVAMILGAGLFGLWHIGPGIDQAQAGSGHGTVAHTVVTVVAMTAAGLFLAWLRMETGSIWAPVAVHAGLNMTMALFARVAGRRVAVAN